MQITLKTSSDQSYPIKFLRYSAEVADQVCSFPASRYVLLVGEKVDSLYGDEFLSELSRNPTEVMKVVIPSGEEYKRLETLEAVLETILKTGIDRDCLLLSLGGGVTGDLTGLAASLLLRGVSYLQIPTTLLAQVDASVGGKTGVNSLSGKNLIGTFHQPKAVLISPHWLSTLEERDYLTGLAEVVKHGACLDTNLFEYLEKNYELIKKRDSEAVTRVIRSSLQAKAKIVETDVYEHGQRQLLNFGHTLGHAIEAYHDFSTYTHGEAISLGMVYAVELSQRYTGLSQGDAGRIKNLLEKFSLPTALPQAMTPYLEYLARDKKRRGEGINWVLLKKLGQGKLRQISLAELSKETG